MSKPRVERRQDYWAGGFAAMASDCELLIDADAREEAEQLLAAAVEEALRIERKFSRYRDDNIVHRIHHSAGAPVEVDDELAHLLDFADRCYRLSEGRFDVTSGVLRKIWRFDGRSQAPSDAEIESVRRHIGWPKVTWRRPFITLPEGMEIDLGGIGKEYAVDRTAEILASMSRASVVVNFGGDLSVTRPRRSGRPWRVGVEAPDGGAPAKTIDLRSGALATSGDARRFIMIGGRRLPHILDPRTGRPVDGAPRSVTVLAGTCTEAGLLATLAMLHGPDARRFLEAEGVEYWCTG